MSVVPAEKMEWRIIDGVGCGGALRTQNALAQPIAHCASLDPGICSWGSCFFRRNATSQSAFATLCDPFEMRHHHQARDKPSSGKIIYTGRLIRIAGKVFPALRRTPLSPLNRMVQVGATPPHQASRSGMHTTECSSSRGL